MQQEKAKDEKLYQTVNDRKSVFIQENIFGQFCTSSVREQSIIIMLRDYETSLRSNTVLLLKTQK